MGALQDHQRRIAQLRDGLSRLLQLHERLHELHAQSMALAKARPQGHEEKIQALREEAEGLIDEIGLMREQLEASEGRPR
jgi:hypothetical protein